MRRLTLLSAVLLVGVMGVGCSSSSGSSPSISAVHWVLDEPPAGSQLRITGYIGSSSCNSFDRVDVEESDSAVDVQVLVRFNGAEACTADMRMQAITVELENPLGIRELTGCQPIETTPGVVDPEGCLRIEPGMPG